MKGPMPDQMKVQLGKCLGAATEMMEQGVLDDDVRERLQRLSVDFGVLAAFATGEQGHVLHLAYDAHADQYWCVSTWGEKDRLRHLDRYKRRVISERPIPDTSEGSTPDEV